MLLTLGGVNQDRKKRTLYALKRLGGPAVPPAPPTPEAGDDEHRDEIDLWR